MQIGAFEKSDKEYKSLLLSKIKSFSLEMFKYWTEDEFTSNFRKMLMLEQYRNPKMASLLNQYLTGGIIGDAKELIVASIINTRYSKKDPEVLALEYFSPIYIMMGISDSITGKSLAFEMVKKHIEYYMENLRGDIV